MSSKYFYSHREDVEAQFIEVVTREEIDQKPGPVAGG